MNFQAAVKGIAPAGGIRPASHITASFVSATKAEPAAYYFDPCHLGRETLMDNGGLAAVIEGGMGSLAVKREQTRPSDLSRSSILSGQRSNTDERHIGRQRFGLSPRTAGATSRSGGHRMVSRNLGNPCSEKVRPHRPRQTHFTPADPAVGVWARLTSDAAPNPAATDWLVVGRGRDTVRLVPAKDARRASPVAGVNFSFL